MMDTEQLVKLLEMCCDVMNLADELDINVKREIDAVTETIVAVSDARIADDLKTLRAAALKTHSNAVQ